MMVVIAYNHAWVSLSGLVCMRSVQPGRDKKNHHQNAALCSLAICALWDSKRWSPWEDAWGDDFFNRHHKFKLLPVINHHHQGHIKSMLKLAEVEYL